MKGLARGKAHLAAQQEYFAKYVEDDINPSSGQRYDPKPLVPVPIFIVDDTIRRTPGRKWSRLTISTSTRKCSSRNVPDQFLRMFGMHF